MAELGEGEALAVAAIAAIRKGQLDRLRLLLADHPELATSTIVRSSKAGGKPFSYPLLGAATDWPGHFPDVAATIALMVEAGADVNARCSGPHREVPLHGAASSDDIDALDALLDLGADIEAAEAVIAGGTAIDDAVGFGQWRAARRLVERGARTALWHDAALGLMDRVAAYFAEGEPPARHPWASERATAVTIAFWCACHGGQRDAARYLLERGADRNWPAAWDGLKPLDAARRSEADEVVAWLRGAGAKGAAELNG